jgi:hypothetical protein
MKLISFGALVCLSHFLAPAVYADVNWNFSIENPAVVVNPTDSFSVRGKITNLATSTSALTISEPCPLCVVPADLWIGAADSTPFNLFSVDTAPLKAILPGLTLNPGESFTFTAYTVTPVNAPVPAGNYEFAFNDLFLPAYGFSSGGPLAITVVPEPSTLTLSFIGVGLISIIRSTRKKST